MRVPLPTTASSRAELAAALDPLTHGERLRWIYGLNRAQQYRLFALADGSLRADELVGVGQEVVVYQGKNGLPVGSRFQKRIARLGDRIVGYNHAESLFARFAGPGHFVVRDAPDGDGVWIDYRSPPTRRHLDFPPLIDNDRRLRGLVFGNLVDVLRRVSRHVFVGRAYKDKGRARTLAARVGSRLPTAPFVLVRMPR